MVGKETLVELRRAAEGARSMHYAPYSNFLVLAAVETCEGDFVGGSNVEIANYSLSKHAEEVAILVALRSGVQRRTGGGWLKTLYVVGASPCGSCRQFAYEWATAETILVCERIDQDDLRSSDLMSLPERDALRLDRPLREWLPDAFGPRDLGVS